MKARNWPPDRQNVNKKEPKKSMRGNTNNTSLNTPISFLRPCNDTITREFHILRARIVKLEVKSTDDSSKEHVDLRRGQTGS